MTSYYKNCATVFFHEICHVDQNVNVPPNPHITDYAFNIEFIKGDLPVYETRKAYNPQNTKILARYEGSNWDSAGYYVQRNAYNLAMYALAIYLQKQLDNIYPTWPLVTDHPFHSPFKKLNFVQYTIEDGKVVFTNIGDDTADVDDCALSTNITAIADVNQLIPSWAYPTAYRKAKASWEEDLFPSKDLYKLGKSSVDSAITDLDKLVNGIFKACPDTVLLLALILPSSDSAVNDRTNQFNEKTIRLVRKKFEGGKHILLVNMNSFVTTDDLVDGKNPSDTGYQIMADAWARGLQRANAMEWISKPITSVTTTLYTTVHPTVTTAPDPTPTPAGYAYWFFGFDSMGDFPLFKIQGYGSSTSFDVCEISPE